jgi:competence transcription factor ComK
MNIFKTLLYTLFIFTSLLSSAETEILYLSGTGSDDTIEWDFMVTGGRKANEWSKISVPSNWELQGFGEYNYGHDMPKGDEKGIYKTTFHVPPHWADKTIFIVFQGSMTDTEVKINGQSAGPVHQGGFYSFSYNISDLIDIEGGNSLEVTVAKMSANESINMAERRSDYWVFGGIFRPVYLKAVPREHISWTAIDGRAEGQFIIIVYLQNIRRGDNIKAQIFDKSGRYVGQPMIGKITSGTEKISLSTTISQPQTWSAESPHLYYVGVTLNQGENVIHSIREQFGFRTFEVRDGEGLFLNGNRITLKGVNRHSFWPTTGRTLNYSLCLQDIQTMKEMNMNAVRMSHYPPDNYFLDLCDEYGLYVLDELAGWQKPPYDTPTGERLVKEMVMRDVNHPSILFWDNGNEGGWNTELDDEWDKYDPQLRRVLHPWELHGGVDTDHYENYRSTLNKLQQGHIFMPTEHLHGLYDGGLGAGLDDYWKAMWGHPLTGGMFLWVFADEGVVRTDLNGIIDTDGNHAPDGILGPFHEREASFYTIKEIWSPVYIESLDDLPAGFDVPLENRFDFINLNLCFFEWKLVNFVKP